MLPFAKLMPLFGLAGRRLDDLTLADLRQVAGALGIQADVTDELKEAGLALLKGNDIHSVADMIKSPESISQLVNFLSTRGIEGGRAMAEVDAMYDPNSGIYDIETPVSVEETESVTNSRLISHAAVGWRLPG